MLSQKCQISFYTVLHPRVSGHMWDKSYPLGIDQVRHIQSKVDEGKHCHHHFAVPRTLPLRAWWRSPRRAIFSVKAEHWPHHWYAQVEQNLQQGAHHHKAIKGHAAHRFGPPRHSHYDHQCSQSKAESIDDNAVDCGTITRILAPIGQSSKDDAGHKALNDFEKAGDGCHVAHHSLAWPGSTQGHFSPVGQSTQDGADGDSNAEVSDIAAGVRTLRSDKEEWVDYRGRHVSADRRTPVLIWCH